MFTLRTTYFRLAVAALLALAVAPAAQAQQAAPTAFTYQPPAPVDGRLMGVTVLGSTGLDLFIVRADAHHAWEQVKTEYNRSYVIENMATPAATYNRVAGYFKTMQAVGVKPQDSYLLVSSGAAQARVTPALLALLRKKGYKPVQVSPNEEGRFAALATLPAAYAATGFITDIGSGNTKLAWHSGDQYQEAITYGSKAYLDPLLKTPAVMADVKQKAQTVPAQQRGTCLLLGGVAHELASLTRHGTERYTPLLLPTSAYGPGITPQQRAGLLIYQDIAEATGCQQFVFDWYSNFGIGYLLERF